MKLLLTMASLGVVEEVVPAPEYWKLIKEIWPFTLAVPHPRIGSHDQLLKTLERP